MKVILVNVGERWGNWEGKVDNRDIEKGWKRNGVRGIRFIKSTRYNEWEYRVFQMMDPISKVILD